MPVQKKCSRSRICCRAVGSENFDCRQAGDKLDPKLGRGSYVFNSSIEGIEQADAILIIGSNPRVEAPVLNARIRKRWRTGALKVGLIGYGAELTYPAELLGAGPEYVDAYLNRRAPVCGRA